MNYGLLFCFLLSHFISDFILQSNSEVKQRFSENVKIRRKANLKHTVLYFITSFVLTIYFFSVWTLIGIIMLAVLHYCIDNCKSAYMVKKPEGVYELAPFFLDQLAHIVLIFVVNVVISYISPWKFYLEVVYLKITEFIGKFNNGISYNDKVMLSVLLFVLGVWGVGIFIRLFFNSRKYRESAENILVKLDAGMSQKKGTEDGGYIIGILERIFIICAIVFGIKEVIGFVLATKSIARLKKFDDDRFVEDFIIGSFISFISAIITGFLINTLNIL